MSIPLEKHRYRLNQRPGVSTLKRDQYRKFYVHRKSHPGVAYYSPYEKKKKKIQNDKKDYHQYI